MKIIRFAASKIKDLIAAARAEKVDALWLQLQPRPQISCILASGWGVVEAEDGSSWGDKPRLEVLEFHNHVLRKLAREPEVGPTLWLEIQFNDEMDFCVALSRSELRTPEYTVSPSFGSLFGE